MQVILQLNNLQQDSILSDFNNLPFNVDLVLFLICYVDLENIILSDDDLLTESDFKESIHGHLRNVS
jgi:hypothetical protein